MLKLTSVGAQVVVREESCNLATLGFRTTTTFSTHVYLTRLLKGSTAFLNSFSVFLRRSAGLGVTVKTIRRTVF